MYMKLLSELIIYIHTFLIEKNQEKSKKSDVLIKKYTYPLLFD